MTMHQFGGALTNDSATEIRFDSKMIQADMDTQRIMAEINNTEIEDQLDFTI